MLESAKVTAETISAILADPKAVICTKPVDIAFLYRLRSIQRHEGETEFSLDTLASLYMDLRGFMPESMSDTAADTLARARKRIGELADQRLLMRHGLRDAYALTSMGMQIADEYGFTDDEEADRLELSFTALVHAMGGLLGMVERREDWQEVNRILRLTVADTATSLERRQASLDRSALRTRIRVRGVLNLQWDKGVPECMTLLERSIRATDELHRCYCVRYEESSRLLSTLERHARAARKPDVVDTCREVSTTLTRVGRWIETRHSEWTRFQQDMGTHIRDNVLKDRQRLMAHLIRAQANLWLSLPEEDAWLLAKPKRRSILRFLDVPEQQVESVLLDVDMEQSGLPDPALRLHDDNDEKMLRARIEELLAETGTVLLTDVLRHWVEKGDDRMRLSSLAGAAMRIMTELGNPVQPVAAVETIVPGLSIQPFHALSIAHSDYGNHGNLSTTAVPEHMEAEAHAV